MKKIAIFFVFSTLFTFLIIYFMKNTSVNKQTHQINLNALKEYDIRGTIDKDLFIEDAYFIARSVATSVYRKYGAGDKRIVVGFDGRLSSPEMFSALKQGLLDSGIDILSIGMSTSPIVAYTNIELNADASIMITASHNPSGDNGFKIAMRNNEPFFGESIKSLSDIMFHGDFYKFKENGTINEISVQNDYIKRILKDVPNAKPLKIVWDCGNGVSGISVKEIIKELPGEHITLFCDIDGHFPNHEPDPSVMANLKDLQKAIIDNNADFGVAFDGDADRMTAIDGLGRIIANDRLLVLFARDVISRNPGASVIMEVKSSNVAMEEIKKVGGNPIMYKTGHSCIKNKMKEIGALLAGETSGHFYWKEKFYGFDDGVYSALRLLDLLSRSGHTLAQLNDTVPVGFGIEEVKIKTEVGQKEKIMQNLIAILKEENAQMLDIDGVRVMRKHGWWLIRASQTSDALTIKCEGDDEKNKEKMITEIQEYLKKASDNNISIVI